MSVACMSDRALNELAQQPVVVRIQSGHKRYPGVVALQDVNFTLWRGARSAGEKRRGQVHLDPHVDRQ